MEWEISLNQKDGYLDVVTSGLADKDGSLAMVRAIFGAMQADRITKILIDHRNIKNVIGNTCDIYTRPETFRQIGVPQQIKIAEIIRPEHAEHFQFFETVCRNRGFQLSIFQKKDAAVSWLTGKTVKSLSIPSVTS